MLTIATSFYSQEKSIANTITVTNLTASNLKDKETKNSNLSRNPIRSIGEIRQENIEQQNFLAKDI